MRLSLPKKRQETRELPVASVRRASRDAHALMARVSATTTTIGGVRWRLLRIGIVGSAASPHTYRRGTLRHAVGAPVIVGSPVDTLVSIATEECVITLAASYLSTRTEVVFAMDLVRSVGLCRAVTA